MYFRPRLLTAHLEKLDFQKKTRWNNEIDPQSVNSSVGLQDYVWNDNQDYLDQYWDDDYSLILVTTHFYYFIMFK